MNDKAFRKQLSDKRRELQAIVSERAPLVKRMEELVRSNRSDLAALQKIPEWGELHKKVVALNEKYETVRRRQLKIFRDRVNPAEAGKGPRLKKKASVPAVRGGVSAPAGTGSVDKKISK